MRDIDVLIRMEEAADTLRKLPRVYGPMGHRSHWPEYVSDGWLAYASEAANDDLTVKARSLPSPEDIDRMDEALPWLQHLGVVEGRAVWARANGRSWGQCAKLLGASDWRTGRSRVMKFLGVIAQRLCDAR